MKSIRRVLKRALDTEELQLITSDELLNMPTHVYQQIRRNVTIGVKTGAPRYLCSLCGHPVYAPNYRTGPGWKHFNGAPITCEWWTGQTASADEVSAQQFQGQQESALHSKIKNLVADLLRADSRMTNVVVDEVLHGSTGYKKPDVRAEFGDRPIAVELQLSTTQIPVIIERDMNGYVPFVTGDATERALLVGRDVYFIINHYVDARFITNVYDPTSTVNGRFFR